jgi:hypothetical protein
VINLTSRSMLHYILFSKRLLEQCLSTYLQMPLQVFSFYFFPLTWCIFPTFILLTIDEATDKRGNTDSEKLQVRMFLGSSDREKVTVSENHLCFIIVFLWLLVAFVFVYVIKGPGATRRCLQRTTKIGRHLAYLSNNSILT